MKKINQVVCVGPGLLELQKSTYPERQPGEALLKIERVGICGTDLHAYGGNQPFFTYPRILGHELAAQVVEIDDNPQNIRIGDRVAVIPYKNCENCAACGSGKPNCCENIQVFGVHQDGGMREFVCLPVRFLISVTDLSLEEIALIEPLAICMHALERSQTKASDNVVVIGCGPIGIGIIKLAMQRGANVVALDSNPQRVAFAQNVLGINHVYTLENNVLMRCRSKFGGDLASIVFDATGNRQAMERGHQYMRHGGSYVLVGLFKGDLSFSHPEIHAKETSLLCSRNATKDDFLAVIDYLKSGVFPVSSFITNRIHASQISEEMKAITSGKLQVMKAMMHF
ncbi:MAG: L-galactonate-5-dehydrogenase [Bacteroidota bacterium]|jgi:2-desacetyl-2-hydroxyethyl bacteriochlorophyllide A dehydrogenase